MMTDEERERKEALLEELKNLEEGVRYRQVMQAYVRTFSFQSLRDEEAKREILNFQKIFGRYIPDLLGDEHATITLHQRMIDSFFTNPVETINRSRFDIDMKRLRKAVHVLAEIDIASTKAAMVRFNWSENGDDEINDGAKSIYDAILDIQDHAHHYENLPNVLDKLEGEFRAAAEFIPDRRNINWQAVHAVAHLHGFWESWTETPAPRRALNPESPFANYLRDAFEFFEIQGDPLAAFKRWAALEKQEPQTWK
ncbi:hypothetical protein [Nitratireductor sp. GZWM139]|uniref:hypothetical protein n=1 Tax=Nitratireductor sp. GZWM139 TaxID=2950541 RepID=UPI0024BE3CED|nr:hypothetical protein [Nitratireductor sp. GZWM139]MDJ1464948.1 hypothetical protein [Nitratireductor sp. GZWM139]